MEALANVESRAEEKMPLHDLAVLPIERLGTYSSQYCGCIIIDIYISQTATKLAVFL